MLFNQRTLKYLSDMGAKLVKSEYKIISIDFEQLKALVNKVDTYQKRNGKFCKVEHHFGRWISFTKESIKYRQGNHTYFDSSVYGLEMIHGKHTVKYLSDDTKSEIIQKYNENK